MTETNVTVPHDPDAGLMLRFKQGDQAAFESLLTKYFPRVLNFIVRFVNVHEEAEDLTQEVFIKVYKGAWEYSPKAQFKTWLYTVARNLALNEIRRRSRIAGSLDAPVDYNDEGKTTREVADENAVRPDAGVTEEERATLVREALQALPANQREAIILLRYEDFTYEEIARTMGLSLQAVKSLLNRAKENLRVRLARVLEA